MESGLYDFYNYGQSNKSNALANPNIGLVDMYGRPITGNNMSYDTAYNSTGTNVGQVGLPDASLNSGGMFDNWSMSDTSDLVGAAGGLYQMYQGNKMMGLAEDDLNMRKYALQSNIANRDRFVGDTKAAFA